MKSIVMVLVCAVMLAASPVKNGYEVGDKATDFKLKNVDGKMVSLADFKEAKGFIVIFDCNTCPYSKAYNERIIDLNEKYAAKGFPVITINANDGYGDSYEDMVRIANKKKYKFPYLYDETQAIAKTYGATNTPHVFVLNRELKVSYIGAIDDNARNAASASKKYVENAVDALLTGKSVPVTKTKAVGCGIRWRDA
ncbi:MAG TPA: thioredoxin family protein [Cyclobacteriaceae bacterium]|nr:thioredoxin family protein [Cyclobacteriaceae bacterium]